ncbi:fumarylacetoacetate hydrolase family protein [Pseudomonas veronii]|uniref:fumarylacetoacetate hydrolase family protein n=1 Tax=Pseudomonas TaxID=286 RepID=UPI00061DBE9A|nr:MULTISPECIES: fumarylacetoacetate hydrolase family protein [Pseudomonas]NWC57574.1 fumarylacetoacetate hydrolase family protein [Pseudomonas veronii]PUB23786.1 fumarylacetoacetate (FAA) hydrolase [Pseudomonas sp. GV105]QPO20411.1 fumarylacetoacetate hydrolase family protein [Pseudomonas sp. Y39-6]RWA25073.1 FAA hydrolase family protein [Pseudomonas veronii]URS63576.1 fumarylacetoacetate hydrolase family protein [Pseudomonas sp. Y39-6]
MKLATLNDGTRDGRLLVVSRDLQHAVDASGIVATMQAALDSWGNVQSDLDTLYRSLNLGEVAGSFELAVEQLMAPLPRAWQWLDGSCFLSHGELMQKAFNLEPIENIERIPLIYQGAGDDFLGPRAEIPLPSEAHGIDFEGEFAVLLDDVPMGCPAEQALKHIRLVLQLNDVSLRALAPREMKTGFGFLQAKPTTSFAPVAVTPDELGDAWVNGRIHLPLKVEWNGEWFGHPHGGAMHFGFHQLIAHAALTRKLSAGTLIGSGTVSNADRSVGSACISERRAIETIAEGAPRTGFMHFGDRIRMEVRGPNDDVLFGAIDQRVVQGGWTCA